MSFSEKARVVFVIVFLVTIFGLGIHMASRVPSRDEVDAQERAVLVWVKKMNVNITGVSCDGWCTCTISPVGGRPWRARCSGANFNIEGDH